jgi:hypothetical protein
MPADPGECPSTAGTGAEPDQGARLALHERCREPVSVGTRRWHGAAGLATARKITRLVLLATGEYRQMLHEACLLPGHQALGVVL